MGTRIPRSTLVHDLFVIEIYKFHIVRHWQIKHGPSSTLCAMNFKRLDVSLSHSIEKRISRLATYINRILVIFQKV